MNRNCKLDKLKACTCVQQNLTCKIKLSPEENKYLMITIYSKLLIPKLIKRNLAKARFHAFIWGPRNFCLTTFNCVQYLNFTVCNKIKNKTF